MVSWGQTSYWNVGERLLGRCRVERRCLPRRRKCAAGRSIGLRGSCRRPNGRLEPLERRELLAADLTLIGSIDVPSEQPVEFVASAWPKAGPADVNDDQLISAADGLLLVNTLNQGVSEYERAPQSLARLDVSGDGKLTGDDFLAFVESVNSWNWEQQLEYLRNAPPLRSDWLESSVQATGSGGDDVISDGAVDEDAGSGQDDAPASDPSGGSTSDDDGSLDDSTTDPADDTSTGNDSDDGSSGGPGGSDSDSNASTSDDNMGNDDTSNAAGPSPSSPSACVHRLTGTTVDEGDLFILPLTLDHGCAIGYSVAWGDGPAVKYQPDAKPTHVYLDDDPSNTPKDTYVVTATVQNMDGTVSVLSAAVVVKNVPPTASDDKATTDENSLLLIDVGANDHDPGVLDSLSVASVDTTDTVGTVTVGGGGFVKYDPRGSFDCLADGESATDTFSYTLHDDDDPSKTTTGNVTITVTGRREIYFLSYDAGGTGKEDGEKSVPLTFTVSPAVKCDSMEFTYDVANYDGATSLPLADRNDVDQPSGTVRIAVGSKSAAQVVTPIDDQIIEENEWFPFSVGAETNKDYELIPQSSPGMFKILDDEWRFVTKNRARSKQFGPVRVEAFSNVLGESLMNGAHSFSSHVKAGIGSDSNSRARIRANNYATLSRPGNSIVMAEDFADVVFICDSQDGDIWRKPVGSGGNNTVGPLSATTSMIYDIDDTDDVEARLTVEFDFDFIAGGTITKSSSKGLTVSTGDKAKAKSGGFISTETTMTYSGGVHRERGGGLVLFCNRGPLK